MAMHYSVDDDRRILNITLSGTVSGRQFQAFSCDLYGGRLELFEYDCVLDLLEYEGDISYADLNPLQQIYLRQPAQDAGPHPGFIVTLDPNFHFWATALDEQFPGRKHYVAASLEEAFAGLEELRKRGQGER